MLPFNPKIFLLNYATSVLNTETEKKKIQTLLQPALSNKLVIMTTTRLSSIKNADKIIVMDNDSVVEFGSHDQN